MHVFTSEETRAFGSGCIAMRSFTQYQAPLRPFHPNNWSHFDGYHRDEVCPAEMERVWVEILAALVSTGSPLEVLKPTIALSQTKLCADCRSYAAALLCRMRQGLWDRLPSLFKPVSVSFRVNERSWSDDTFQSERVRGGRTRGFRGLGDVMLVTALFQASFTILVALG